MRDTPSRRTLGDYGIGTHLGVIIHGFQPANPVAFNIKNSILVGLRENQYDGGSLQDPYEHLSTFHESCLFCCPDGVTEDQKKLQLFALTLTGRAKDWLHALPNGTIQKWDELEEKFLKRFFPLSKLLEKRAEISSFEQGDTESLYDAWERFRLLLKRCPPHGFDKLDQMQIFTLGLNVQTRMLLDASAGGSLKVKTDHEVEALIEKMAQNEYRTDSKKKKRGEFGVIDYSAILANQAAMNKQLETLTKEFHGYTMTNKPQHVAASRYYLCGEGHAKFEYVPEGGSEEAKYMGNYQKPNPYYDPGYNKHPNLSYPQQQQQRKPSALEETMINFMKMTHGSFEEMKKSQEAERKINEASRKMLEAQIGLIAKQLVEQNKGEFSGNTKENHKKVNNGVVENERKRKNHEGEKSEPLIDVDSILRKPKSQLLMNGDKPQVIPYYVKLPYPRSSKNKEIVQYPKNKNCKVIELKTRNMLKPVSPESTKRKVDEVGSMDDSKDDVGNKQEEKNKNKKRMLVESKWKYPP